ncbi:MAG: nicotinate (nicotinamide) nucleotide adenylyltransferase [Proteobacteria bacterium]|nr:nicotinate (nicotinamide) nucleotide adenylyltransferase [Pseudomonadota bacterium]
MMRVGLFGGSFNPPHQGHIHISQLAIKKLGLNQIWWIPTAYNSFKEKGIYESYTIRCEKCEKISKNHPKIHLKKISEIRSEKLIKNLQKKYRNHQFFWIMGADNLLRLHEWENFRGLIKTIPLAIFSRENFLLKISKTKSFQIYKKMLSADKSLPKFKIFKTKNLNISSTQIRNNAKLYS